MLRKERAAINKAREKSRREAARLESLRDELRSLQQQQSIVNLTENQRRNCLVPTKEILTTPSAKKRTRVSTKLSFEDVLCEKSRRSNETSDSSRHTFCADTLNRTGKVNIIQ